MTPLALALAGYMVCLTIVTAVLLREKVHPVRMAVYAWLLELIVLAVFAVLLGPAVLILEVVAWLLH